MKPQILLNSRQFELTLTRLCHELIENHGNFSNSVLIGVQPRGIYLSDRIHKELSKILNTKITYGKIDPSFYRDDFRRRSDIITPADTTIDFPVEGKKVILVDDVFYTGRTIRAALDALLDFGRPSKVELLVLIDRRFWRQLPMQPDYVGKTVDSVTSEKVKVLWKETDGEDKVTLFSLKKAK